MAFASPPAGGGLQAPMRFGSPSPGRARAGPPGTALGGGAARGRAAREAAAHLDGADNDLFEIVDRNDDKLLNRTEFQQFRDGYCSRRDPTRGNLFPFIDRDGDGVVSQGEFR